MSMYKELNFCIKLARKCRNLSSIRKEPENYYEVLGLKSTASQNEIKESYFKKTKLYHPDVVGSNDANLRKFRRISEAYEVLGSPVARREYDEKVLGVVINDAYHEDAIENKQSILQKNEEFHKWAKNYANEMRINEYVSRNTIKSDNDFFFTPAQQGEKNKLSNADSHIITKVTVAITLILILFIGKDSELISDLFTKN